MQINSKNQRILLFSDVHQEIDKIERILSRENYDVAVCLGDWFDSFDYNSERDVEKTCNFLKKWIFKPNFHTLKGNHCLQYLYDNSHTICSGYYERKDKFITKNLGSFLPAVRDKFKWYLWIDDFLCSHAGVNAWHFPPNLELNKLGINNWLGREIQTAELSLINGGYHWTYIAGQSRCGRMKVGGLTWQDFDTEFEPIAGLKQLVGHTPHGTILNHVSDGNLDLTQSNDLDIDCHLNEYLIIENDKLEIKKYRDL